MALPLTPPTFYRKPDIYLTGSTVGDMLFAVYSSLTSSVDYRGTSIPSTHTWTWATASTGGTFTTVYNTAIPTGSPLTQAPTIIFAGSTGSFTPTMTALDTYAANLLLVGVNKNGTTHTSWTGSLPMTTGSFTGFQRATRAAANATTTFVRTFVSQESIFLAVVQDTATAQMLTFAGAIIEPATANSSNTGSAETDDRIYGLNSNGSTINTSAFLSSNDGFLYYRGSVFLPSTSTVVQISKRNHFLASVNVNNEIDIAGNYYFEKIKFIRFSGGAYIANASLGTFNGVYFGGATRSNKSVIRSSSTDLFHIVPYNFTANSNAIVLKAAS